MIFPFVGPSNEEGSTSVDTQRSINLFPIVSGGNVTALYGTPGIDYVTNFNTGGIRGMLTAANGRAFVVSASGLFEIGNATATTTYVWGNMSTNIGDCTMADNGTELAICDGSSLYLYNYTSNAFAAVSDVDFPGAGSVCFLDGYFIVNDPATGQFYISALYDGTSWDALDFATAEGLPDNIVRVFATNNLLIIFGDLTTEFYTNSGATDFPFTRTARIDTGCAAAQSVCSIDNTIFWVGQDDKGFGQVYKMQGSSPVVISTPAVAEKLQAVTDISDLKAFVYQENGHTFYFLTGGDLETSHVYDVSTGQWHERAYLNSSGEFEQHRAAYSMFAYGVNFVGDKTSGDIYRMGMDLYDDDGDPIKRTRICRHFQNDGEVFRANSLQVDFERGVGLYTGQGSDPQAWIRVSRDFGKTWGPELYTDIGAMGKYLPRAMWRKLGLRENFTVECSISDPVKVAIRGAYLK